MNRKTLKIIRQYCKLNDYDEKFEKFAVKTYNQWDKEHQVKLIEQMKLWIKVAKNKGIELKLPVVKNMND